MTPVADFVPRGSGCKAPLDPLTASHLLSARRGDAKIG